MFLSDAVLFPISKVAPGQVARFTDLGALATDRSFLHVEVKCIEAGVSTAQIR